MKAHAPSLREAPTKAPSLRVYLLGLIDFETCLNLQQRLLYEACDPHSGQPSVIVCEHPPLLTIGRNGSRGHLLCDPGDLKARQIDVRWINRGGGCWLHLPGQLAVYPILSLESCNFGLADYIERLERTLLDVAAEFRIAASVRERGYGLWSRQGQLASIGVAVRRWTTYHGFYLNVCPQLEPFRLIQQWPSGDRASSFSAERQRPIKPASVREAVVRKLAENLGFARYYLHTGHPTLKAVRRTHAHVGSAQ